MLAETLRSSCTRKVGTTHTHKRPAGSVNELEHVCRHKIDAFGNILRIIFSGPQLCTHLSLHVSKICVSVFVGIFRRFGNLGNRKVRDRLDTIVLESIAAQTSFRLHICKESPPILVGMYIENDRPES